MKEIFETETMIFPGWSTLFRNYPDVSRLLDRIGQLRRIRSTLNFSTPHIQLSDHFWRYYDLYIHMRLAEAGRSGLPIERAYQAHKECLDILSSLAHRTFWARWLYLERAFELASLSGDLLFGAICLRTMVEDVWALLELANFERQLQQELSTVTADDLRRIRRHGDLLFKRFLPPQRDVSSFPESDPPEPFGDHASLQRAFQSLNDYIHPNYGSHLLALFPENTKALTILMDAYVTVYQAFLQVPWVHDPVAPPCSDVPPISLRSWDEESRVLVHDVLPAIQRHRAERGLAPAHTDPSPHLRSWLDRPGEPDLELAWQVTPDWFVSLRPLAEFVAGASSKSDRELCGVLMTRKDLGLPVRPGELMTLAGARELANEFAKGFSQGRPSHEDDPIGWFRYCTKALELMLTTTQYKIGLMIWTCIRQLSDGNPVGSVLPMRSAIEHYAVAVYLGDRLERAWDEVVKGSSSGKMPVDRLLKLEEQVARFLAGTKGTEEEATKWKEEWSQLGLDRAINLRSATETGLANDVLGFLYDFGSRVIHGERARGVELCPPTHEVYCRANLSRALLGLDLLVSIEYMLNTLRNGVAVLRKLQALARALAKPGANQTKILRTIAMARDKLIQGKHFTGSGTMDNPFVFAEGLEYYFAFYKLCEQLSLDTAQRTLVHSPSGRFFDAVPDKSGGLFYFAVPMEQFGSHQEGEV